jgi:hypothetical protein
MVLLLRLFRTKNIYTSHQHADDLYEADDMRHARLAAYALRSALVGRASLPLAL